MGSSGSTGLAAANDALSEVPPKAGGSPKQESFFLHSIQAVLGTSNGAPRTPDNAAQRQCLESAAQCQRQYSLACPDGLARRSFWPAGGSPIRSGPEATLSLTMKRSSSRRQQARPGACSAGDGGLHTSNLPRRPRPPWYFFLNLQRWVQSSDNLRSVVSDGHRESGPRRPGSSSSTTPGPASRAAPSTTASSTPFTRRTPTARSGRVRSSGSFSPSRRRRSLWRRSSEGELSGGGVSAAAQE